MYPWDYKVSELPKYYCNFTIPFIDLFAWLGWATDLKTVSTEMIRKRVMRTGDGSHRYAGGQVDASSMRDVDHFWGFGELLIVKRNYFWKQPRPSCLKFCFENIYINEAKLMLRNSKT